MFNLLSRGITGKVSVQETLYSESVNKRQGKPRKRIEPKGSQESAISRLV